MVSEEGRTMVSVSGRLAFLSHRGSRNSSHHYRAISISSKPISTIAISSMTTSANRHGRNGIGRNGFGRNGDRPQLVSLHKLRSIAISSKPGIGIHHTQH